MTYAKAGGDKKLTINKKTGNITVKKGTKKGVHKIRVRVTAAGDGDHNPLAMTVTVKIRVK